MGIKKYLDDYGLNKVLSLLKVNIRSKPTCKDINDENVLDQKIVELTQAQYNALATKDPATYYVITDDNLPGSLLFPKLDWANVVSITATQIHAGYTCPEEGMIIFNGENAIQGSLAFSINNVVIAYGQHYSGNDHEVQANVQCPVDKGDVCKVDATPSSFSFLCLFIPWKK